MQELEHVPTKKYQFSDVGRILRDSWLLVRGLKLNTFIMVFLYPILLYLVITILMILATVISLGAFHQSLFLMITLFTIIGLIYLIYAWKLMTITYMLGHRQSLGRTCHIGSANRDIRNVRLNSTKLFIFTLIFLPICLFSLAIFMMISLNFTLGLVFTTGVSNVIAILIYMVIIYFTVAIFAYALPLIVISKYDFSTAIRLGFVTLHRNILVVLVTVMLMELICYVLSFTIIANIWTLPMYYAMYGVLYRDAFGAQDADKIEP